MATPQEILTGSFVRIYSPMRVVSGMIGEVVDYNPHADGGNGVYVVLLPTHPLPFFFSIKEITLTDSPQGW